MLRPRFSEIASPDQVSAYVDALAVEGVPFDDPDDPPRVTRDRDDDYLFALAVTAGADLIVSGDKDLTSVADPPCAVLTRPFNDPTIHT